MTGGLMVASSVLPDSSHIAIGGAFAQAPEPQSLPSFSSTATTPNKGPSEDRSISRRISTCRYFVGFSENSDRLSEIARAIVDEAAQEAARNDSRSIRIVAYSLGSEPAELATRRRAEVERELDRVTAPEGRVSKFAGALSDDPTRSAAAYINVCDPNNIAQTKQSLPKDPDQPVEFLFGSERLVIPLRYLHRYFWRDTPFEPVERKGLWSALQLGWPGLQDATTELVRRCEDEHIGCRDVIAVSLQRVEEIPHGQYRWDMLPCCATDGTPLRIPR